MVKMSINHGKLKAMTARLAKNIRFAMVVAMSRTVKDVRTEMVGDLRRYFTIRNQFLKGSFKVRTAEKSDAVPTAQVGSIQKFMLQQTVGGKRLVGPHKEGAPPVYARKSKSQQTRQFKAWPEDILRRDPSGTSRRLGEGEQGPRDRGAIRRDYGPQKQKRKFNRYFIMRGKSGKELLVQRLSSGRGKLRLWYVFSDTSMIKARWPLVRYVAVTKYHWRIEFNRAMRQYL